jgi:hypothetical protein
VRRAPHAAKQQGRNGHCDARHPDQRLQTLHAR